MMARDASKDVERRDHGQAHPDHGVVGAAEITWLRDEIEQIADIHESAHSSLGELAAACEELRTTVSQFTPAIRDLEVLADAGIGVREGDRDGHFDALEMDAYSKSHELCRVLSAQAADLSGLQAQIATASRALELDVAQRAARWRKLRGRLSRIARSSLRALTEHLDSRFRASTPPVRLRFSGTDQDCESGWMVGLEAVLDAVANVARGQSRELEIRMQSTPSGSALEIRLCAGGDSDSGSAVFGIEPDRRLRVAVAALGGRITDGLDEPCLLINVPVLQAEVAVLVLRVGEAVLACPMAGLKAVVRRDDVTVSGDDTIQVHGEHYPIKDLAHLTEQPPVTGASRLGRYLALVRDSGRGLALCFDAIESSERVRVLAMLYPLPALSFASTAAIMSDGTTVPVLDPSRILAGVGRAASVDSPEIVDDSRRQVLVVDDSVTIRKVTEKILTRNGYDSLLARDGREALDVMRDRTPDLILLDIEMPRMNGFQLLEAMAGDPRLAAIPVVMVSSRSGPKHQAQAAELGVTKFLGKPFQEQELLETMEELLP